MSAQSRRGFIHELGKALGAEDNGGQQAVAQRLGMNNRQGIDNQIRLGFNHKWKPSLIKLATETGVEPHPELLQGKDPRIPRYTTPVGKFIYELKTKFGSIDALAKEIGCSESTLRRMCERRNYLSDKQAARLETIAAEVDVPLPAWWEDRNVLTDDQEPAT